MKIITKKELADVVGFTCKPTPWFEIDQLKIDAFADVTLDHQFIHVDPVKAKNSAFGGTVAHGLLVLSLLPYLVGRSLVEVKGADAMLNYGYDKVRFISPVKAGSEIRALCKVVGVDEKNPGKYVIRLDVTIETKGEEKPALIIEWLIMPIERVTTT